MESKSKYNASEAYLTSKGMGVSFKDSRVQVLTTIYV